MTTVTARPRVLLDAAEVGTDHTSRWRGDADDLAEAIAAFRRGAIDVAARIADLDVSLHLLADRTRRLDDELRAVGEAFLTIDAPMDAVVRMSELQLDHLVGGSWSRLDVSGELAAIQATLADRHLDARERAEAVHALLAGLPRERWLGLAEAAPVLIGNTDGVPVELRYVANRISMTSALATAEREAAWQRAAGGSVDGRLAGRIRELRRLLHTPYEHRFPKTGHPQARARQVLLFDPAGDGRAAEVFGDLATATSVATIVPGITNRLDNFGNTSTQAGNLYDQMSLVGHGSGQGDVATIAWLGYDTPELLDAPSRIRADEWAPVLADFQAALPVSLGVGDARTTVVAHSYGSLLTGVAIREEGLRADAFAVIGSPGMNVLHASQLGLPDDIPLYAGRADWDPVSLTEGHGTDPAKPYFGAIPFVTDGASGHSSYTDRTTESLVNLAYIALGHDHKVARDGWDLQDLPSAPLKAGLILAFPVVGGVLAGYEAVDAIVIETRDAIATVREVALDARDLAAGAASLAGEVWDETWERAGDLAGDAAQVADDAWDGAVEGVADLGSDLWRRTPWG